MSAWKTRGLRGSTLEEMVNRTNEYYRENGLALMQKIPTPITPIDIDKSTRHITLAYFEQKSTVDYIGVIQEIAVCFDAKECSTKQFALSNIHEHQLNFMRDFEKQGGVAFILLFFSSLDELYYMRMSELEKFRKRMEEGGLKHIKYEELDIRFFLENHGPALVPYLEGLNKDLELR